MCTPRASASTSSGWAYSRSIRSRTRRSRARSRRCWSPADALLTREIVRLDHASDEARAMSEDVAVMIVVAAVVVVALLLIVPLGLRLVAGPEVDRLRRVWPWAASPAVLALTLPRGVPAAVACLPYLAMTLVLAASAALRCLRYVVRGPRPWRWPVEVAVW